MFKERFSGKFIEKNLRIFFLGFVLIIVSEILLFISFFWSFFNFLKTISLPFLIQPGGLPLLKTFLLLSRGVSVTVFHRFLFRKKGGLNYLLYTVFLGVIFEICQVKEYSKRVLSINSFTYGSTFFMLTGLHGFHVLVGIVCLLILTYFVYCSYINSLSLIASECLI